MPNERINKTTEIDSLMEFSTHVYVALWLVWINDVLVAVKRYEKKKIQGRKSEYAVAHRWESLAGKVVACNPWSNLWLLTTDTVFEMWLKQSSIHSFEAAWGCSKEVFHAFEETMVGKMLM